MMQVDGKPLPKEGLDKEAADRAVKDLERLPLQATQPCTLSPLHPLDCCCHMQPSLSFLLHCHAST